MIIKKLYTYFHNSGRELLYGVPEELNLLLDNAVPDANGDVWFCYVLGRSEMIDGHERGEVCLNMCRHVGFDDMHSIDIEKNIWERQVRELAGVECAMRYIFDFQDISFRRYKDAFAANMCGVEMRCKLTERVASYCKDWNDGKC